MIKRRDTRGLSRRSQGATHNGNVGEKEEFYLFYYTLKIDPEIRFSKLPKSFPAQDVFFKSVFYQLEVFLNCKVFNVVAFNSIKNLHLISDKEHCASKIFFQARNAFGTEF